MPTYLVVRSPIHTKHTKLTLSLIIFFGLCKTKPQFNIYYILKMALYFKKKTIYIKHI